MKSNAILFPCDYELVKLSAYINLDNYIIKGLVVLENSNVFTEDGINIPVYDVSDVQYDIFDTIVVIDKEYYGHPFIDNCIEQGENVLYIEKEEKEKFDISLLDDITEEQSITVPVVFVAGTAQFTEKFHVQLAMRKSLSDNGYNVSQIGSKTYSNLFGFHSYPAFMRDNMDNTQKIILFKKYVKHIEMQEQPDLIVIGIPGGIMAINKKHHFDFGMTAYMVSQAVEADYVIMTMLYDKEYSEERLETIRQVCRFRLNFEIDGFHLSNTLLDLATLKDEQLKFIKIGKKEYEHKVDGLYDLMNPADMDKVYEDMIAKLSSYNVNQIF